MLTFPNAKLNLGLRILGKRSSDGYHELETVFLPIALTEALELTPNGDIQQDRWDQRGLAIDGDPKNNTVLRTVRMLREEYAFPWLDVTLYKKIPFGAGLGGGSADAAFALKMINERFALGLSEAEMVERIASIGADCPFFIHNKPMLATGIGEFLTPIEIPTEIKKCHIVLIKPQLSISTKEAYAQITCHPEVKGMLPRLLQAPLSQWRDLIVNDFEEPLFRCYPLLDQLKKELYEAGAFYASMTGSGSAIYAFFKEPIATAPLQQHNPDCFIWQGHML